MLGWSEMLTTSSKRTLFSSLLISLRIRGARFKIACFPLSYATKLQVQASAKHPSRLGRLGKRVKGSHVYIGSGEEGGARLGRGWLELAGAVRELGGYGRKQKLQHVVSGHSGGVHKYLVIWSGIVSYED